MCVKARFVERGISSVILKALVLSGGIELFSLIKNPIIIKVVLNK